MGFWKWFFGRVGDESGRRRGASRGVSYTQRDIGVVAQSAQRMIDIVNESLEIAKSTKNVDTRLSRTWVAAENVKRLKELARRFPFVELRKLGAIEKEIERLQLDAQRKGLHAVVAGNEEGTALESQGKADEALAVYERLAAEGVDTPHTYRRLAILYRKRRDMAAELRVLDMGLRHVPKSNAVHHRWLKDRRDKLARKGSA